MPSHLIRLYSVHTDGSRAMWGQQQVLKLAPAGGLYWAQGLKGLRTD